MLTLTPRIRINHVPGNDGPDSTYMFVDDDIALKITGIDGDWFSVYAPEWQDGRLSYRAIRWDQPHRAMTTAAVISWWTAALKGLAA